MDYEGDEEYDEYDEYEEQVAKRRKKDEQALDVPIYNPSFWHFQLKPELLSQIVDCGFEYPSEVQQACIPQAVLGTDVVCQAKSGMGKTTVIVLATLQQLEPTENVAYVLVMCHTRELASKIGEEYKRFAKYMTNIKIGAYYVGLGVKNEEKSLEDTTPHVIVSIPAHILSLIRSNKLQLKKLKHFVLYDCHELLEPIDIWRDVREIFRSTPHVKQVMMFSGILDKDIRPACNKFVQHPLEVYVNYDAKMLLLGMQQYYVIVNEEKKNDKLFELLNALEYNQVLIFVNSSPGCRELAGVLEAACRKSKKQNMERFKHFRENFFVCTHIHGRFMDMERVSIIFNYDMPYRSHFYMKRLARAADKGFKGLAICFIANDIDYRLLEEAKSEYGAKVTEFPDSLKK